MEMQHRLSKPVYWRNAEWAVTSYGMEPVGEWDNYCIEKARLGEVASWCHDLPDWPLHMAGKRGIDPMLFLEVFVMALSVHEGKYKREFRADWYRAIHWRMLEDTARKERRRKEREERFASLPDGLVIRSFAHIECKSRWTRESFL